MNIILKGKSNVYEQIVKQYKKYITLNIIQKDEKLPSCRQLAKELGINPNTVERAYKALEQEGYIKAIPKKGIYVIYEIIKETKFTEIKKVIEEIKESIDYDNLLEIINKVYRRGEND